MKRSVVKIDLNNKIYGGRIYENQFIELLSDEIDFKRVFIKKYGKWWLDAPRAVFLWFKYHFFSHDTLLLTNHTTFFAGKKAHNIVIIHHIDSSFSFVPHKLYQYFCDRYLFTHKKLYAKTITVANYWKDILINSGFSNVNVIYNSFNIQDYQFSDIEKHNFLVKYGLYGKPVVYLGVCLKIKGVELAYNALKDFDVNFVTSGTPDVELPVPNLVLDNREYRLLLASSDIVLAMSTFKEGWNRTVHEASLCSTRVIGSGVAGMSELLKMANQVKVEDFQDLKEAVISNLNITYNPPRELTDLNLEYFKREWEKVLCDANI